MRRFTRKALHSTLPLILLTLLCALALAGGVLPRPAPPAAAGQPADPLLRLAIQQAKLTAPDGAADDVFGWSVAVSGDTALVGEAVTTSAATKRRAPPTSLCAAAPAGHCNRS